MLAGHIQQRPHSWQDCPLPGLHSVVTWQLNVTIHTDAALGKCVSVLRDPVSQIELARMGYPQMQATAMLGSLGTHLREGVGVLAYMAGLTIPPNDWAPPAHPL